MRKGKNTPQTIKQLAKDFANGKEIPAPIPPQMLQRQPLQVQIDGLTEAITALIEIVGPASFNQRLQERQAQRMITQASGPLIKEEKKPNGVPNK